jgi:predicted double-glycine peptidase
MKYAVIVSMIYGLFLFPCFSFESSQEITRDTKERLYACGYNSLYLFLKLHRINVSLNDVKSQVNIGENGTSFYDLKIAACHLGIISQVIECSYPTLQKISFPCIAWIDRSMSGRENSQSVIGHFVVLLSCTPDEVVYLDGTSGQKITVKAMTFMKQWNGMLLVPESQLKNQSRDYTMPAGIIVFIIGILCVGKQIFRKKKTVLVIITVLFLSSTFVEASEITHNGVWRTQENETANSLYLLLRYFNVPCDYHALKKEMQSVSADMSMKTIHAEAKKRGLLSNVYFCQSVSALDKFSLPFLIHTGMGSDKESSLWNGNFLLVIGRGKQHFMVIDCGTVQMSDIPEETLRRYWSGYVLAKTPKQKTSFVFSPIFFSGIIGVGILFLYLGFAAQSAKSRKNKNTAVLILVVLCSGVFASQSLFAESPPDAQYSAAEIKQVLLETANAIKSLRVNYRSEYYKNPDAPKGTYLYRKILTMSPYFLNHTNSHPCDLFSWDNDPLLQQAFIQKEIGYNIFPFCSVYFVIKHSPSDGLPGTLPGEFFFNATGIWVTEQRKAPMWENIPVALRDVANHPEYNHVRPLQEKVDNRWCHVLS